MGGTDKFSCIFIRKPMTLIVGKAPAHHLNYYHIYYHFIILLSHHKSLLSPLRGREEWRTTRMMNPEIREMAFAKPVRGRPRIRTPSTNEELLNNDDQL